MVNIGKKALAIYIVRVILALSILAACFYLLDFSTVMDALKSVPLVFFAASLFVAIIGGIVVPAMITQKALSVSSINLSLPKLIQINFAMRFYVLILPRPIVVSMRWYRYKKAGTGPEAAALVVFERIVQLLIIAVAAAVLIFFDIERLGPQGTTIWAMATALSVILLVLFILFISTSSAHLFHKLLVSKLERFPPLISLRVEKLWASVVAFQQLPFKHAVAVLGLSCIAFVLFVYSAYLITQGMALELSLIALVWVRSVVFILTLIPVSVGGIGVREAAFVMLLSLYNVSAEAAFAFAIALFAVQLGIGVIGATTEIMRLAAGRLHLLSET